MATELSSTALSAAPSKLVVDTPQSAAPSTQPDPTVDLLRHKKPTPESDKQNKGTSA